MFIPTDTLKMQWRIRHTSVVVSEDEIPFSVTSSHTVYKCDVNNGKFMTWGELISI